MQLLTARLWRQAKLHQSAPTNADYPALLSPFLAAAIQTGEWPFPVPFAGRLDLTRVGLMGHSFGAATVTLMASKETRVKSVVAHDLWTLPLPEVSALLRGAAVRGLFVCAG